MSDQPQEEPVPEFEGPDPRDWERNAPLTMAAENVRAADDMLELLRGKRHSGDMSPSFLEAVGFLERIAVQAREELALQVLAAHGVPVPEATEAAGGFRGDSSGEGTGDHLRRVQA